MSICIQVIETPELEHLERHEIALPTVGGTIGRGFDCTVQLPDHSNKLSRVHASISLADNGDYLIKDLSSNGLSINQQLLGYGNSCILNDGDILQMAGYQMFVSNFSPKVKVIEKRAPQTLKPFSISFDKTPPKRQKIGASHIMASDPMAAKGPAVDATGTSHSRPIKTYTLEDIQTILKHCQTNQPIDTAFIEQCLAQSLNTKEQTS